VAPRVLLSEGQAPEFVWRGKSIEVALPAGFHIDTVDALPVRAVAAADLEFPRVILRLREPEGDRLVPRLGFDDREFRVAVDEDVVGGVGAPAPPAAFDAT